MGKFKQRNIQGRKGQSFAENLKGISLDQIVIVAIDAAKNHPKALVCNYFGDIIEDSFFFAINSIGLKKLVNKIRKSARTCNALRILIGVESSGHYHKEVVRYLESQGHPVTIINAYTTSEERSSALNWAKTDDLDLAAIAKVIMQNKGTESKLPSGIYDKLLTTTRARRSEVRKRSALQVEIRQLMDVIWPGFQGIPQIKDGKPCIEKIFCDFWGQASCFIMRNYPLPQQILTLETKGLQELSKKHSLKIRRTSIEKLVYAAKIAVIKSPEVLEIELFNLQLKLDDWEQANQKVLIFEQKIEELFVQTPGVILLSVPEIGVTTAANFTAEVGPAEQYTNAGQIIKKAGTNSLVTQTGGGDPVYGQISKQGNPRLREVIRNIGYNLTTGKTNLYFKAFAKRLKNKGKRNNTVYIAVGNKFIRVAYAMLRDKKLFSPLTWDGPNLTKEIICKIKDKDNQIVAQKLLNNLLSQIQQKAC